jgi:hypothetical protein
MKRILILLAVLAAWAARAQEASVQLQCAPVAGAADGMIVRWGTSPAAWGDSALFPLGTNFVVSNVDLSAPVFFRAACFSSNASVTTIGSGTNQHTITNHLAVGPWSPSVPLYTPEMELSCWADGSEFVVCGWGEAGYGYRLMDGPTPRSMTNEVGFFVGTNGPWFYSEPMTNSRYFTTNIIIEPAG